MASFGLDTGAFDENRYWIVEVHYAKADPDDILMVVQVTNAGPEADTLYVLPTAWFRNTWSWDSGTPRPALAAAEHAPAGTAAVGGDFDRVIALRRAEADEFYAELTPEGASADEAMVMRQAFAGMLWGKQFYYYDVAQWLDGDPAQPPPPASRATGRNSRWRSFDALDIMSMPDKWEYPWLSASSSPAFWRRTASPTRRGWPTPG